MVMKSGKFYIVYGELTKCVTLNDIIAGFENVNDDEGFSLLVEDFDKVEDLKEITKETNPEYFL